MLVNHLKLLMTCVVVADASVGSGNIAQELAVVQPIAAVRRVVGFRVRLLSPPDDRRILGQWIDDTGLDLIGGRS